MMCPYLFISINELLISIISFIDINKYGLNVKTAAHKYRLLSSQCDILQCNCNREVLTHSQWHFWTVLARFLSGVLSPSLLTLHI